MGPALVALGILIIMAALGAYIIGTGDMFAKEGFAEDPLVNYVENYVAPSVSNFVNVSGIQQSKVVSLGNAVAQMRATLKLTTLTNEQKITAINSKVSEINALGYSLTPYTIGMTLPTLSSAASTTAAKSTSAAASGTLGLNTGTYDAKGAPTGATKTDLDEARRLADVAFYARTNSTSTDDYLAKYKEAAAGLSPEFKKFLEQVQSKIGTKVEDPTADQLALAQGVGVLPETTVTTTAGTLSVPSLGGTKDKPVYLTGEQVLALYSPALEKIKAHQTPSDRLPSMEPEVDENDTTDYASIQKGRTATASIRQMIRDDVAQIIREETDAARIGNPYEVKYDYM